VVTGLLGQPVLGRQQERDVLERLLDDARAGHGGALVLHGEPGVGKTALLNLGVELGDGFDVVRTAGVEGETELPYAALQQLVVPIFDLSAGLPDPQREALSVAFGLDPGHAPNPFLVGLAVLGLLSEAAADRPVLCVVDDAQWLDRASARALAFIARRLLAEKIGLLFAARERDETFTGLPELLVGPLGRRDARILLESVLPTRVDDQVLERIVAETHGNPLALLELPRGMTPAQLAGGFGLPAAIPLPARIEEHFMRRVANVPPDARLLLLLAAADPTGDLALVSRAAKRLGIDEAAARALGSDGLLDLRAGVVFRHPLARSAVYRAATVDERSAVHRALADATDPQTDPDRRAWHRAQATSMPDEDVAAELERSAVRAQARGGFAAAAAFLERSSVLTLDPPRRSGRELAAARAKYEAGALDEAVTLASNAERGALDRVQRAELDLLRARISFAEERGNDAPRLLLTAAKDFEPLDAQRAREIYLEALSAALFAGRLAVACDAREVAAAARALPEHPTPPTAADRLLDGLARMITEGPATGTPAVRHALRAFGSGDVGADDGRRWWRWLAGRAAGFIWDYEAWDTLTLRQIRAAREAGALAELPFALSTRVGVCLFGGDVPAASSLLEEANGLAEATGSQIVPPYGSLTVAAFRGREDDLRRSVETTTEEFLGHGEGMGITLSLWATALLYNGLARYEDAFAAADRATEDPHELWFSHFALIELIESASRIGREDRATEALQILSTSTSASGTPWAFGVEARSRALLAHGDDAEKLYREAVDRLEPTRLLVDLARARLLYGEWLRRERRRLDAREQLRIAYDFFADAGMEAFAERARIELRAAGDQAPERTPATLDQLTPQEAQISRLVAQGHTNREIAAQLFISPSTVEYHLGKVFRKLDVKSRTQLATRVS
jgi:DNA-binding CsgD family transcriptional regulator